MRRIQVVIREVDDQTTELPKELATFDLPVTDVAALTPGTTDRVGYDRPYAGAHPWADHSAGRARRGCGPAGTGRSGDPDPAVGTCSTAPAAGRVARRSDGGRRYGLDCRHPARATRRHG